MALAYYRSLDAAAAAVHSGAGVDGTHKQGSADVHRDVRLRALGQEKGPGIHTQVIGRQLQTVDHLDARAFLVGRAGTDRATKVGGRSFNPQRGGGQQVVVELGHATGLDPHVLGCGQVAAQQGVTLSDHLHLVAGQAAIGQAVIPGAVDGAIEQDVEALEGERTSRLDAPTAAIEVEQAQFRLDLHRHAALLGNDRPVNQHVVGAHQGQAAAGIGGDDACGVLNDQAVEAGQGGLLAGDRVGDGQRTAADALAVTTAQFYPIGGLDGAQHGQRACRAEGDVTAGTASDHAALDHALVAGSKADRAVDGLQHAGVVQIHQAAVEIDGAVGA